MTVRSMAQVLNEAGCKYLEAMVPEDIDVVLDISPVTRTEVHEDEDAYCIHDQDFVRVGLYVEFPRIDRHNDRGSVSVRAMMPLEYLNDGDIKPLVHILDELWDNARFLHTMRPVLPKMEKTLRSHQQADG